MEQNLRWQLQSTEAIAEFRDLVVEVAPLRSFETPASLITYLHSTRTADRCFSKDSTLTALLSLARQGYLVPRDTILLAFVPMLHSVARHATTRCPWLARDDIEQFVVLQFMRLLRSSEFSTRNSHVAYAMSRALRRYVFLWTKRQARFVSVADPETEDLARCENAETMERLAALRHFLHRCHSRGLITQADLDVLVRFKLDDEGVEYSNAARQRMKRLMFKLRQAAVHDVRRLVNE